MNIPEDEESDIDEIISGLKTGYDNSMAASGMSATHSANQKASLCDVDFTSFTTSASYGYFSVEMKTFVCIKNDVVVMVCISTTSYGRDIAEIEAMFSQLNKNFRGWFQPRFVFIEIRKNKFWFTQNFG